MLLPSTCGDCPQVTLFTTYEAASPPSGRELGRARVHEQEKCRRGTTTTDPAAPKANSIVVAVTAAVRNAQGELLLIERTDNGLWALPGGARTSASP